jgi:peroxiredoxin
MTSTPIVGQPAPELRLPTLNGQRVDLAALRGQRVLVSFLRHAG